MVANTSVLCYNALMPHAGTFGHVCKCASAWLGVLNVAEGGSAPEAAAAVDGRLLQQLHGRGITPSRAGFGVGRIHWEHLPVFCPKRCSLRSRLSHLLLRKTRGDRRQEHQMPWVLPEWRICKEKGHSDQPTPVIASGSMRSLPNCACANPHALSGTHWVLKHELARSRYSVL